MGFTEVGERFWREMPVAKRLKFLKALATAMHLQPPYWGCLDLDTISHIPSFDDLPSDLRGRLIRAMTEKGFSIKQQAKSQRILDDMFSRPTKRTE